MEQTPSDTSASKDPSTRPYPPRPKKRDSSKRLIETSRKYGPRVYLNQEQQLRVIEGIAIFMSTKKIREMIQDEYGKKVSEDCIDRYRHEPAWQPMIQKKREEFEAKVTDIMLVSKRKRLEELQESYFYLKEQTEISEAVKVLSHIREEVEGKSSGNVHLTQYNQFNGLSDEELRKVIAENTRFLDIAEKKKKQITIEVTDGEGTERGDAE